ncbi:MAG: Flp pilus assembly protein CpaB [Bacillota bacterium]
MKKVYILSILMAVIAGVAVYLFASSLERNASASSDASRVVIAVKEIPANTQITEDMVALTQLTGSGISPYAATDIKQVVGKITKYPLLPKEQVLIPQLAMQGKEDSALSFMLEKGRRAVSVAVDDVSGVSGFISKGDYVDVIGTVIAYDAGGKSRPVSTMLVENVPVLQTGTKVPKSTDSANSYTTVTLSVTPQEALKINYAATNGKLRLLLRPVLDKKAANPKNYP